MRRPLADAAGALLLALAVLLAAGCRKAAPAPPLPELQARLLDGTKLTRAALLGAPAVIALFVPG